MKHTTLIRKVDDLGRLVLPKDLRKELGIQKGDSLELSVTDDVINIRKYSSIKDIEKITLDFIHSIYDIYGIDSALIEGENVIIPNKSNINERIKQEKYYSSPIVFEGSEIGKFIIFSLEEEAKKLLSLVVLFLKMHLEE